MLARSVAAAALTLVPFWASAQTVCLDARNMRDSTAVDGHTILMRMIDGSRYHGILTTECPGLRFNGFIIFPANSDYVCEGIQSIRVLQNAQVCRIGRIVKLTPHMAP
jgi:hypothetical protein